jgi:hypothetical protein
VKSRDGREAAIKAPEKERPLRTACSGSVDTSLLAVRALGKERVRCALPDSPLVPRREGAARLLPRAGATRGRLPFRDKPSAARLAGRIEEAEETLQDWRSRQVRSGNMDGVA